MGKTENQIQELSQDFKTNNKDYQILAESQGLATKKFKLGLGAMKAFDKIVTEAKENSRVTNEKNNL